MSGSPQRSRTKNLEFTDSLSTSLIRLGRRIRLLEVEEMLPSNLISVLITLSVNGPLTPSELADFEHVSRASMTRILYGLDKRNLVTRQPHDSDGRISVILLSNIGQMALMDDRRHEARFIKKLGSLSLDGSKIVRHAAPILFRLSEHQTVAPTAKRIV